jgi:Tol biopolymer transport system component
MSSQRILASALALAILVTGCENAVAPGTPDNSVPSFASAPSADPSLACSGVVAVDLLTQQGRGVGKVLVQNDAETVYVTYETTDGWFLETTALSVTADVSGIPVGRSGNPTIGRFPYGSGHAPGTTTFTYQIPIPATAAERSVVVAAYAQVGNYVRSEAAWGGGEPLSSSGNWATWFTAPLESCASRSIDSAGGTLALENVTLEVPPGALPSASTITVRPVELDELAGGTTAGAASSPAPVQIGGVLGVDGTAFEFGPDGLVFDPPATIIIEYDEAAVVAAGLQEEQLAVFLLDGPMALASVVDADANTVTAAVAHFSTYFVGAAFADLEVSEFYEPSAPARVGEAIQFGADVKNLGPAPVTGATFTWVAFGDVTLEGVFGFCTEIADPIVGDVAVSCAVDALDPGQTDGIPVLRITPRSVGTVEIWGSVGAPTGAVDPIGENDRVSATIDVAPAVVADLATTQLYEPTDPLKVGVAVQYGADVSNAGPDPVANATFTWVAFGDVMLEGVFGACTEVADAVIGDVVVQCPIASLAVGGTAGLPVLRITPQSTGEVTVWGTVTAPAGAMDPDLTNNRLTASGSVQPAVVADLAVTQWLEPEEPYKVGTPLEFGADVSNLGPDAVTGAVFTWVAFGDVTLDGVFGSCTAIADAIFGDVAVQCPVDALGAGQIDGIPVLRVTPQSVGEVTVWGTVTAPAGAVDLDADNNRRTTTLDVGPAIVADLTVSQLWLSSGTAAVGEALEYAADVQNLGPDAVSGATFTWVAFGDVALGGVFGFCTEIADPIFGDVAVACPVEPLEQGQTDGIPVLRIIPQSAGEVTIWATVTAPSGVLDPDADNNRRTLVTAVDEEAAPFSGRVVFTSDRDGQRDLYIRDLATGGVTRLTNDPAVEMAPAWSPDGTRIAYHKAVNIAGDQLDVFVIDADGTDETRLTSTLRAQSPTWSPDGQEIAYSDLVDGNWEIMALNLDTGSRRRLTFDPAADFEPTWSGSTIAFVRAPDVTSTLTSVVTISSVDGSGETVVATSTRLPELSPDGTRLTFMRPGSRGTDVVVLDLASGTSRVVATGSSNTTPAFSPDGDHVIFAKNDPNAGTNLHDLWIVAADGSGSPYIADNSTGDDYYPDWR